MDQHESHLYIVPLYCHDERELIGHLQVDPLNARIPLDAATVWGAYVPRATKWQLGARPQPNGQALTCPRCRGTVSVAEGAQRIVRNDAPDKRPRPATIPSRDEARERMVREQQAQGRPVEWIDGQGPSDAVPHQPIILGRTTLQVQ